MDESNLYNPGSLSDPMLKVIEVNSAVRAWVTQLKDENKPITVRDLVLISFYSGTSAVEIAQSLNVSEQEVLSIVEEVKVGLVNELRSFTDHNVPIQLILNAYITFLSQRWAEDSAKFTSIKELAAQSRYSIYHLGDLARNGRVVSVETATGWKLSPTSLSNYRNGPERRGRPRKDKEI